jgi:hypothetical protein
MRSAIFGAVGWDRPSGSLDIPQMLYLGAGNADYFPGTDPRQEGKPQR